MKERPVANWWLVIAQNPILINTNTVEKLEKIKLWLLFKTREVQIEIKK